MFRLPSPTYLELNLESCPPLPSHSFFSLDQKSTMNLHSVLLTAHIILLWLITVNSLWWCYRNQVGKQPENRQRYHPPVLKNTLCSVNKNARHESARPVTHWNVSILQP